MYLHELRNQTMGIHTVTRGDETIPVPVVVLLYREGEVLPVVLEVEGVIGTPSANGKRGIVGLAARLKEPVREDESG